MTFAREGLQDKGRPVPQQTWDRQYRDGAWEFLDSLQEMAHYAVIGGYIRALFASPRILDVGCGPGRLLELLEATSFKRYLGIDLSPEAIRQAVSRHTKSVKFQVADLNAWNPRGRFSVIVFCESLNYARHPAATLARYARALEPNGAIVVSLYRHRNHTRIWRNARRDFRTLDSTTVINHPGRTWDIRVLQPKPTTVEDRAWRRAPSALVPGGFPLNLPGRPGIFRRTS